MVRMINKAGRTMTVLKKDIGGNVIVDVPEDLVALYLRNKFVLVSEGEESVSVVEETTEVEETPSEPSLEDMTKKELQSYLTGLGIKFKLSDSKAALLSLASGEEE